VDPKLIERVASEAWGHGDLVVYGVPRPHGHAVVELRDERGRLVGRSEGSNFLATQYAVCMRSFQRAVWAPFAGAGAVSGVDVFRNLVGSPGSLRQPFFFPNWWFAAWNDTAAEAPTTEQTVVTDGTGIVACALRVPTSISAANKRGSVNTTESVSSATGESMVYDWPTSAGNGTFRSIGYTAIRPGASVGELLCRPSLMDRRYIYKNVNIAGTGGLITQFTAGAQFGSPNINTAGDLIIPLAGTTAQGLSWISLASGWRGTPSYDEYGAGELIYSATPGKPSGAPVAAFAAVNSFAFIGESGGKYWFAGQGTGNAARLRGLNATTGAITDSPADTVAGSTSTSGAVGCIIGTTAYVAPVGGGTIVSTLTRYDLTASPPTITGMTALTFPTGLTGQSITDVKTDGTDLYVYSTAAGIFRFNTSGTVLQHYGTPNVTTATETLASPYGSTLTTLPGLPVFDQAFIERVGASNTQFQTPSSATDVSFVRQTPSPTFIAIYDSKLHLVRSPASVSPGAAVDVLLHGWAEAGWNLGSRILLGSASTKNSGQTMKITYGITLPNM
jgi:hypothetical protein